MKQSNKIFILITLLICIFLLSGCSNIRLRTYKDSENKADSSNAKKQEESLNEIEGTDQPDKKENSETQNVAKTSNSLVAPEIQPAVNTEILIYTINSDTADLETLTVLIPTETKVTPELVVDYVVESLEDRSVMVGIDSVTQKDDAVIVSFKSNQPPVANVGGGIENSILDAIAQSIIDNNLGYRKVIYRVEGNAYISGHYQLGIDEVYLEY